MAPAQTVTIKESASGLGCSKEMAYKLFKAGELRGYKIGRVIRVFADSIAEYQQRNSNREPAQQACNTVIPPRANRLVLT